MISDKHPLLRSLGLWAVTTAGLFAGNFVKPAEGPVPFRRDRIPLDVETMAGLSRNLVTLARAQDGKTPADRRAAAQMLALALALDPGNAEARNVISVFEAEKHQPQSDPEPLEKSRNRIWQHVPWLETPEAGSEGQALASCLTDVMATSDPDHPRAKAALAKGELGAWKGWIAEKASFEPTAIPEATKPGDPKPGETEVDRSGFLLENARVSTVMWVRTPHADRVTWEQKVSPLQMTARVRKRQQEDPKPFSISIGPSGAESMFHDVGKMLVALLKTRHGTLPAGGHVAIHGPDLAPQLPSSRRQSISAAAAVLADAAISGREPDATIIGVVDETGAFKLSTGFWNQLQALGPGTGRRLILPAAAAEYLPSMLALEKPQLFLDHEILLAANFRELVDLSAKNPDEPVAKFIAGFREIREKAGNQQVGQYVANPFVRRRLVDIAQTSPCHYSARMLAIQGAGNRPTYVTRPVLASELRRAIEPMDWIVKTQGLESDPTQLERLGSTYDLCREQVDRLFRYASKDDRPLLDEVQGMVTGIRTLDRVARARGVDYDAQAEVYKAYSRLTESYQGIVGKIAAITGETDPAPSN